VRFVRLLHDRLRDVADEDVLGIPDLCLVEDLLAGGKRLLALLAVVLLDHLVRDHRAGKAADMRHRMMHRHQLDLRRLLVRGGALDQLAGGSNGALRAVHGEQDFQHVASYGICGSPVS
jgi:hypothetical protein